MAGSLGGRGGRNANKPQRSTRLVAALTALFLVGCAPIPPPPTVSAPPPTAPANVATSTATLRLPNEPDGGWPDADNTGVPDGTILTPWDGDCTVTQNGTVIDAHEVNCDLRIRAADVAITRSRINGIIILRDLDAGYSFSITDSEVHVGEAMSTGIGNGNFTALRVEVTGGRRSVFCSRNCTIEHSWVHAQAGDTEQQDAHLSGIRMGRNTTIRFNTIVCEGERIPPASGCSAALTGYGDFSPIQDNLIEGNLFQSGTASFCAFGGSTRGKPFSDEARDIRFINNVFQRDEAGSCGIHAPIEAFDPDAPGNLWEGNVWDDGTALQSLN